MVVVTPWAMSLTIARVPYPGAILTLGFPGPPRSWLQPHIALATPRPFGRGVSCVLSASYPKATVLYLSYPATGPPRFTPAAPGQRAARPRAGGRPTRLPTTGPGTRHLCVTFLRASKGTPGGPSITSLKRPLGGLNYGNKWVTGRKSGKCRKIST